jgi:hypothetical protein
MFHQHLGAGMHKSRCYDHNFLRFLPILGETILKNKYDNFFSKTSSSYKSRGRSHNIGPRHCLIMNSKAKKIMNGPNQGLSRFRKVVKALICEHIIATYLRREYLHTYVLPMTDKNFVRKFWIKFSPQFFMGFKFVDANSPPSRKCRRKCLLIISSSGDHVVQYFGAV